MLGLPVPRPLMRTHVVRVRVCLNFCSRPVSTTGLRRCPRLSRGGRARGHKGAGAPAGLRAPAARRRRRGGRIHAGGPAELPKPVPAGALQPRRARAAALRRRAAAQRPAAWPARVPGARQGRGRVPPGRGPPGRCTRAPPGAPARGGRVGAGAGSRYSTEILLALSPSPAASIPLVAAVPRPCGRLAVPVASEQRRAVAVACGGLTCVGPLLCLRIMHGAGPPAALSGARQPAPSRLSIPASCHAVCTCTYPSGQP